MTQSEKSPAGSGKALVTFALVLTFTTLPALAGGGGVSLPINEMLTNVLAWLTGPLARTLGTIALVAAAFVWMFLRHERGADFAFRALLGTAIAIGAAAAMSAFMGDGALL
ncbi:MAG TPA: TrbC/VirB2 family protein [Thermoanaerobaculia bacterium]|nr:TrbC/VirB2 family protein [Thermoanaerobaculia bacterium]